MADYKDTYAKRNSGNHIAEDVMLEYFSNKVVSRFGFDEKQGNINSNDFFKVPELVRSAPDYIGIGTKAVFMEVKGYKGTLKIKRKDLVNYEYWNRIMPVFFFFYNAENGMKEIMSLDALNKLVDREDTTYGAFPDNGKRYFNIKM